MELSNFSNGINSGQLLIPYPLVRKQAILGNNNREIEYNTLYKKFIFKKKVITSTKKERNPILLQ
jgi:hypothetical protein